MKIAIIFNHDKLAGRLTHFFTGCYAYHIGLVDEASGTLYDMDLLPRKRAWPCYPEDSFILFDCPAYITPENCEAFIKQDGEVPYGFVDYLLFALRPIYHLFGKSPRNAGGMICSEMVNVWLWRIRPGCTPWHPDGSPPSPCDFYRFLNRKAARRRLFHV